MRGVLKSSGLKVTSARLAILDVLSKIQYPAEIDKIFTKLKKADIDLVTLYRTITLFEEKGIVRRVNLKKDAASYELNAKHHHHIVCTKCDSIEDFESKEVEKALSKISRGSLKFKSITDHSLELFGLCRMCA